MHTKNIGKKQDIQIKIKLFPLSQDERRENTDSRGNYSRSFFLQNYYFGNVKIKTNKEDKRSIATQQ